MKGLLRWVLGLFPLCMLIVIVLVGTAGDPGWTSGGVRQQGAVTAGNVAEWAGTGRIRDGGPAIGTNDITGLSNRVVVLEGRTNAWNASSTVAADATSRVAKVEARTNAWNTGASVAADGTNRISKIEGRTNVWNGVAGKLDAVNGVATNLTVHDTNGVQYIQVAAGAVTLGWPAAGVGVQVFGNGFSVVDDSGREFHTGTGEMIGDWAVTGSLIPPSSDDCSLGTNGAWWAYLYCRTGYFYNVIGPSGSLIAAVDATNAALAVGSGGITYYAAGNTASDIAGWRGASTVYSAAKGPRYSSTVSGAALTNNAYVASFATASNVVIPSIPPGELRVCARYFAIDGGGNSTIRLKAEFYRLTPGGAIVDEIEDGEVLTLVEGVESTHDWTMILTNRVEMSGYRLGFRIKVSGSTIVGMDNVTIYSESNTLTRCVVSVNSGNFALTQDLPGLTTGVTVVNGNAHDHSGGDGAQIAHGGLSGLAGAGSLHVSATETGKIATAVQPGVLGAAAYSNSTAFTSLNHDHNGGDGAQIAHGNLSGVNGAGSLHVSAGNTNVLARSLAYRKASWLIDTSGTATYMHTQTVSFAAGELSTASRLRWQGEWHGNSSNLIISCGLAVQSDYSTGLSFTFCDAPADPVPNTPGISYGLLWFRPVTVASNEIYMSNIDWNYDGTGYASAGASRGFTVGVWTNAWTLRIITTTESSGLGGWRALLPQTLEVLP